MWGEEGWRQHYGWGHPAMIHMNLREDKWTKWVVDSGTSWKWNVMREKLKQLHATTKPYQAETMLKQIAAILILLNSWNFWISLRNAVPSLSFNEFRLSSSLTQWVSSLKFGMPSQGRLNCFDRPWGSIHKHDSDALHSHSCESGKEKHGTEWQKVQGLDLASSQFGTVLCSSVTRLINYFAFTLHGKNVWIGQKFF